MKKKKYHLTKSELEIMQILWSSEKATVRQIHNEIAKSRKIAYTTTLKTMQQMTVSGFITKDTSQTAHIFSPAINKAQIQKSLLGDFLKRTYKGEAKNMILQALGSQKISDNELKDIEAYLKEMKKKRKS